MDKKVLIGGMLLFLTFLTGCGSRTAVFDPDGEIHMVSREEGSGTRTAFTELFGAVTVDPDGKKQDAITVEAEITNNTAVMMTAVAGDPAAVGYISMGSWNSSVKALNIDGVEGTPENVRNGTYAVSRPFYLVSGETLSPAAEDFKNYILSAEGQKLIEENGYIPVEAGAAYQNSNAAGKVVVAGSSSVSPVMEKLLEAYQKRQPDVTVELQTNDSTTGVTSTIQGICDLGMVSRSLREEEQKQNITGVEIARDGILVIVNPICPLDSIGKDQVRRIFTGEIESFREILSGAGGVQ